MRAQRACGFACVVLAGKVRDLWVQKFLRELIVGVTTQSDLAGLILMEIFYCGEGGDVEQVAQTSKQFSRACDCSSFSHSLVFYILNAYIIHIFICLIYTCALLIYLDCLVFCMLLFLVHSLHACVCAHTCIQPKEL